MVVQCTWKPTEGRDINDAISWTLADESTENDVEEEVQAENCLLLVAPGEVSSEFIAAPACQLLISCHPMQRIQYLSVLSDARVMEIYGHHGEYLKTIKNELLEEVEDMAVFKGDLFLDKVLTVCSIKFAGLKSKNEMWLYGVKVGIINVPDEENGGPLISYADVERRLSEMGLSLSDKAKEFKDLVAAQNPGYSGLNNLDMNIFMNLFKSTIMGKELSNLNNVQNVTSSNGFSNVPNSASETNGTTIETKGTESNTIAIETNGTTMAEFNGTTTAETNTTITENNSTTINSVPTEINGVTAEMNGITTDINGTTTEINGTTTEINAATIEVNEDLLNGINNNITVELSDSSTQTLDPPPPSLEDALKLHINNKIEELEKQLSDKMEKSFKEIEAKLFCKLDEIESFVKPQGVQ